MKYIVIYNVMARRGPGRGWPMGWIREGFTFEDVASEPGWVAIRKNLWVPAIALSPIEDAPPVPVRLKFHSQKLPKSDRNYGSFGIVPLYAKPAAHKPHSVILDGKWVEFYRQLQSQDFYDANIHNYPCDNPDIKNQAGQKVDPEAAMHWLFHHDNNKFYGANYGGRYRIPAQGLMGGNLITPGRKNAEFTEVIGLSGKPPRIEDVYNRPDLIHFCWCVSNTNTGATINPPCKSAFIPVLNPVGMKGVTNAVNRQLTIWISNSWLW